MNKQVGVSKTETAGAEEPRPSSRAAERGRLTSGELGRGSSARAAASEPARATTPEPSRLSTPELFARIASDAQGLVKAEIQLAKAEVRSDLQGAATWLGKLGIAIGLGVAGLAMLLVTIVLGLSENMPAWAATLLVTCALLAGAALAAALGWRSRHVGKPLERTRRNLREDLRWAKGKVA